MHVLLARPPRRHASVAGLSVPPLGLAYIASALRAAGHDVRIVDAWALRWSWDRFNAEVRAARPEVLGLTAMSPVADTAARAVRQLRSDAQYIVLGGPHPTAMRAAVFSEMPGLDAAVVGEGEHVAPALLEWWAGGSSGAPPPGVLAPGQPFAPATPEPDLTRLLGPARDLLPNDAYRYLFATRRGFTTMVTSRGCPFRCTFCDKSVGGSRWRARPAGHVVDEMAQVVRDHDVGFINFYDDNFTLRRSRVVEICEEILRRDLQVHWKCEGRADGVDRELLRLMHRAGCQTVAYGVESGNDASLAMLRKDITVQQSRDAFAATRDAGLRSLAYIILGVPGENAADVRRTIAFCKEIGADYAQFSTLVAMPGTPIASGHQGQRAPGVASPLDADTTRQTITDLPPEELQALMREAWRGFYLRPRPLARLARDAVTSGAIREAWAVGRGWAKWALTTSAPTTVV